MAAKRRLREWEHCGDGFAEFTTEKNAAKKRRSIGQKKNLHVFLSETPNLESRKDKMKLEDSISWSSSDDEAVTPESPPVRSKSVNVSHTRRYVNEELVIASESESSKDIDYLESDSATDPLDVTVTDRGTTGLDVSSDNQEDIFSPSISATSSQHLTSQSDSPTKGEKMKATEWIKTLDLKTPTKSTRSETEDPVDDSAKKRKKYKRGGFADQLKCLQSRERSSYSVWKHKETTNRAQQSTSSKFMLVVVESFELIYSLSVSHCTVICPESKKGENIKVLFSMDMADRLQLEVGRQIRISPPWQELELCRSGQVLLLCTNFGEVKGQNTDVPKVKSRSLLTQKEAVWKCPCVTGLVADRKACMVNQHPFIPGLLVSESSECEQTSCENNTQSVLHTTMAVQTPCAMKNSDSILDWIEHQNRTKNTEPGFIGQILRVFSYRNEEMKKRLTFLVEDKQGVICEVICPESWDDKKYDSVSQMEGRNYIFSGLTVRCRTNRDRNPALFSVLDKVWSGGTTKIDSQDSEDKNWTLSEQKPPGFCYIMTEDKYLPTGFTMKESHVEVTKVKESEVITLSHIHQMCLSGKSDRVSFVGKVIYKLTVDQAVGGEVQSQSTGTHATDSFLYTCDCSLPSESRPYYIVQLSPYSCIDGSISELGRICVFRDVLMDDGKLYFDMYSTCLSPDKLRDSSTLPLRNSSLLSSSSLIIDEIHQQLPVLSLCHVKGIVVGVDEESAFSWDSCDTCFGDQLAYKDGTSQLLCMNCKIPVNKPITKMKMTIFVRCTSLPEDCTVTINLKQHSIEKLLQTTELETDEEYEISRIVGKSIGPITCISLKQQQKLKNLTKDFDLLEIDLSHS